MPDAPTYVELRPAAPLQPFVERLWVHRITGPPPPEGRRLLPDGRAHMVWVAGLGARVAGPSQRFLRPPPADELLAIGAKLRPGAVPAVLRAAAGEMADTHVDLDALDARFAARVDAALGAARDPAEAVVALQRELLRRLDGADPLDATVCEAVHLLDEAHATVADAAAATAVSPRELQRRFVRDVGFAPKTVQRILRFQRFMGQLTLPRIDLAGAAALAGYADQAHLSREARRLTGLSPTQLVGWQH